MRKFPCLYDKSNSGYKDNIRKKNAWVKIDESRQKLTGSSVHDWEVLLSRFSRKRMHLKSLSVSGAGRDQVNKAEKSLEEYSFLQWYTSFIRQKKSKSNVMAPAALGPALEVDEPQESDGGSTTLLDSTTTNDEGEEDESRSNSLDGGGTVSHTSSPGDNEKSSGSSKCKRSAKTNVMSEIASFLKFKRNKPATVTTADDLFGKMIAAELKLLPEKRKRIVKQEITTVLYRHQTTTFTQPSVAGTGSSNQQQPVPLFSGSLETTAASDRFLQPQNIAMPDEVPSAFFNNL